MSVRRWATSTDGHGAPGRRVNSRCKMLTSLWRVYSKGQEASRDRSPHVPGAFTAIWRRSTPESMTPMCFIGTKGEKVARQSRR